jgi:hypothetical protein
VVSHSLIPCASESLSASVKAINGGRDVTDWPRCPTARSMADGLFKRRQVAED